jgi:hypothetical protein
MRSRLSSICFIQIVTGSTLAAQVPPDSHEHLVATCVDVKLDQPRAKFGCFTVAVARGLQFQQQQVYWYLRAYPDREQAEAAKSARGTVVDADGEFWLSELGESATPPSPAATAVVGPLQLPRANSYDADISYAVMRPGDRSRVHSHAGPEGWYILEGEQCLETPKGARWAGAGRTMTVEGELPMELSVTGTSVRRSLVVIVHPSNTPKGIPSKWRPSAACRRPPRP